MPTYTGWPVTVLRFLHCEDSDSHNVWITILRTVMGHPIYGVTCPPVFRIVVAPSLVPKCKSLILFQIDPVIISMAVLLYTQFPLTRVLISI